MKKPESVFFVEESISNTTTIMSLMFLACNWPDLSACYLWVKAVFL